MFSPIRTRRKAVRGQTGAWRPGNTEVVSSKKGSGVGYECASIESPKARRECGPAAGLFALERRDMDKQAGGCMEVICGGMFVGKAEQLIRRVRQAQIGREKVQVFEPRLDDRYLVEKVACHNGMHLDASVGEAKEIVQLEDPDTTVVAIVEGQSFDWTIGGVCNLPADNGRRVIIARPDVDFRRQRFGPMPLLMAEAEKVDIFQAICVVWGAPGDRAECLIDSRGCPTTSGDPGGRQRRVRGALPPMPRGP